MPSRFPLAMSTRIPSSAACVAIAYFDRIPPRPKPLFCAPIPPLMSSPGCTFAITLEAGSDGGPS